MKFIKFSEWVTPPGQAAMDDCCPPLAVVTRSVQTFTYPVVAVVSGIGSLFSKKK